MLLLSLMQSNITVPMSLPELTPIYIRLTSDTISLISTTAAKLSYTYLQKSSLYLEGDFRFGKILTVNSFISLQFYYLALV